MEVNKNKIKKAIATIKKNPDCYLEMHPLYQNNEEIASEALSLSNKLYNSIPKDLKDKNSFLVKVLNKSIYPFYRFSDEKKKDLEILKAFFNNLLMSNTCSEFYTDISEIEKKEIKNIFQLFPENFLKNKDAVQNIYSCCVENFGLNRGFFYNTTSLHIELRQDREFMLEIINKNYHVYESLMPEFKKDKEIMKIVMQKSDGRSFELFNLEFKIDLEFLSQLNKEAPLQKRLLPIFLRSEIGAADISDYLEKALLKNSLSEDLPQKTDNTKKMKI